MKSKTTKQVFLTFSLFMIYCFNHFKQNLVLYVICQIETSLCSSHGAKIAYSTCFLNREMLKMHLTWMSLFKTMAVTWFLVLTRVVTDAATQQRGVTRTKTEIRKEAGRLRISCRRLGTIWGTSLFGGLQLGWEKAKPSGWGWPCGWAWLVLPFYFKSDDSSKCKYYC